ncbi:nucleotidyl transferase AbiEii/AbiGii toxin family protein [Actinomyces bowdenii]|uniref:nucleotidyl transferase AbiEii/AbiGii toxin family protein n=1 Tax=Actinomyces bowdenii TaxID=131109 RepID=UPI001FB8699A|nr:nucleotidyl transferase AbiEii/AbiGii toxin family protein [Actinomyces bowdenii]
MDDGPPYPPRPERRPEQSPFEPLPLSPEQQRHVDLMRHIAQEVTTRAGDAFVLKGGTALLLAYGLPRFSTDLDFDGRRTSIDLSEALQAGSQAAGEHVRNLRTAKDTWAVRRHVLHYRDDAMKPLKVEVSYRQAQQIKQADLTTIDGICTYRLEKLASLKVDALVNRTKARDIFDTSYLLATYPEAITDTDLQRIDQLIDIIGLNDLEATMLDDDILNSFDLTAIAVQLVDNTLRLKRERGV